MNRGVLLLMAVGGEPSAIAAKKATSTIPIVFGIGGDPVDAGLVASFNRPGGNATGYTLLTSQMEPKRIGLLHEVVPSASSLGTLINPTFPPAVRQLGDIENATKIIRQSLFVARASTDAELNAAPPPPPAAASASLLIGRWNGCSTQNSGAQNFPECRTAASLQATPPPGDSWPGVAGRRSLTPEPASRLPPSTARASPRRLAAARRRLHVARSPLGSFHRTGQRPAATHLPPPAPPRLPVAPRSRRRSG